MPDFTTTLSGIPVAVLAAYSAFVAALIAATASLVTAGIKAWTDRSFALANAQRDYRREIVEPALVYCRRFSVDLARAYLDRGRAETGDEREAIITRCEELIRRATLEVRSLYRSDDLLTKAFESLATSAVILALLISDEDQAVTQPSTEKGLRAGAAAMAVQMSSEAVELAAEAYIFRSTQSSRGASRLMDAVKEHLAEHRLGFDSVVRRAYLKGEGAAPRL